MLEVGLLTREEFDHLKAQLIASPRRPRGSRRTILLVG
jgi:hypothetical protein